MNHSESLKQISPALAKAWANIGAATKDAKNPFFKSSYATLGEVMEVVKQPLLNEGIVVLQPVAGDETGDYVETVLLHTSGEWISGRMKMACKPNDPQALGSACSYARRYSLQSICFVPAIDDDGEKAMGRKSDPNAELQSLSNKKSNDW